jgi:ribosomal protein S18 acetylase RimI-like enzyme
MTRSAQALRVRPLTAQDREAVLKFVERDPVRDAFIASRVLHDGALGSGGWGPLWGAFEADRLAGLLHVGPNMVPAVDSQAAVDALASVATGPGLARMLVGERTTVERMWALIGHTYARPREIRARQYVYRLTDGQLRPVPRGVEAELATRDDEDEVLRTSAAMHLEEMGEDPLVVDPAGYRRRVRTLIDRGWTFIHRGPDGRIAFKMDIGCAGLTSGQIQGVYAPPALRRRGIASAGMAACCALAFNWYPVLSLYVNDFNGPAVALYERLGFTRMEYDFQTILLS